MQLAEEFDDAVKSLQAVPAVIGVALTGSQAREGMATEHSDADLIVFTEDSFTGTLPNPAGFDIAVYRQTAAATPRLPAEDFDEWYNRSAFLHAVTLFERVPGNVANWIAAQSTFTASDALQVAAYHLDGYLNLAIRALKSLRDGRQFSARLDSSEALGWALTTAFALERRVRPFNKYLEWELQRYPLTSPQLQAGTLLPIIDAVAQGDVARQRDLFPLLAPVAEEHNLTEILNGWGDDLAIIAGPA